MALLNRVVINAASGGTTDFVETAAVTGYQKVETAGGVDGQTYHYAAQSADLSQWEDGVGTWTSSTKTLARTTVLDNSLGTGTNNGGPGTKINFAAAPQVLISVLKEDFSALRTSLTADSVYYVRADGNDSNTGTANTAGGAWLTLQHAINVIASTLDVAGFNITINVGAGTFAGAGFRSTVGGGIIQINGVSPASTIITDGPNDGVFNQGEVFSVTQAIDTQIAINHVTILGTNAIPGNIAIGLYFQCNFTFGDFVANTSDITIDATQNTGFQFYCSGPNVECTFPPGTVSVLCNGVTAGEFLDVNAGASFRDFANWTLTGPANTYQLFYNSFLGGSYRAQLGTGFTDNTVGGTKGLRFNLFSSANVDGVFSLTWFPGDQDGQVVGVNAGYASSPLAWKKAGLPVNTDTPFGDGGNIDGTWGVFKDTSGGGVYLAYNDGGTIKKVALT